MCSGFLVDRILLQERRGKEMNKIKKKLLEKAAETVVKVAQEEMREWPPVCVATFYEFNRPSLPIEDQSLKYQP